MAETDTDPSDGLVERARTGDEAAFSELVQRHGPYAHRVAYLITRSADDADDALQDGTVKAYYALERFRRGAPFRPWYVTIVANEARNRARSSRRRVGLQLRLRSEVDPPPAGPADQADIDARRRAVRDAVDALPERYRQAVALRHLMGMSERDTAAALGVRPGTVKSRISRGLERLRTSLGEEHLDV